MSNEKNAVPEVPAGESPVPSYHEMAQALVEQLRRMRESIPHFAIPTRKTGRRTLIPLSSLPAEFIELTAVARTNHAVLGPFSTLTPAAARTLLTYGDAFRPVADELQALAQFVLFSIDAAKHKVGSEAMTTYAVARRLSRNEEHSELAPHVADMRRALGTRVIRPKAATLARKQKQAAAAAESETKQS